MQLCKDARKPRRILVRTTIGDQPVLIEAPAESELQLQDLVRDNPDLLPVEDFDLTGPVLVIGREATVQSGAIDLACIARGGEIVIVEFKTGPQNSDFRHAIAQLLDYGAHIWHRSFAEFEQSVPVRFFADAARCTNPSLRNLRSLEDAAMVTWPDMATDEWTATRLKIEAQLESGAFYFVLAAQRFTSGMETVMDYMNAIAPASRFYTVEVVHFKSAEISAFEARTLNRPSASTKTSSTSVLTSEHAFLEGIEDLEYKEALETFFSACRGLHYRFEWGAVGTSIRLATPFRSEPITVAWVYPPGRSGWMGIKDVGLGFDKYSADNAVGSEPHLAWYVERAEALQGGTLSRPGTVQVCQFQPHAFVAAREEIIGLLGELASRIQEAF